MSRKFRKQFTTPGVMGQSGIGNTFDWGTTVPADATLGYAPGALFIDVDAAAGSQLWINEGTVSSSLFKVMPSSASGTFATLTATAGTITTGTVTTLTSTTATITTLNPTNIVRASQSYKIGVGAKVGTTSGWTVNAANNLGTIGTVAASQSAATLVVPVTDLHVGDTITGFRVVASINSAGGTVTLDCDLRKMTVAAGASATDASVATLTQVSVTAATASNTTKGSLTEVVAAGTRYYFLITVTTAGSTTVELDDLEFTVTSA